MQVGNTSTVCGSNNALRGIGGTFHNHCMVNERCKFTIVYYFSSASEVYELEHLRQVYMTSHNFSSCKPGKLHRLKLLGKSLIGVCCVGCGLFLLSRKWEDDLSFD